MESTSALAPALSPSRATTQSTSSGGPNSGPNNGFDSSKGSGGEIHTALGSLSQWKTLDPLVHKSDP
ncbi:hypothetical protein LguiA_035262 [Lonicera macranthoides]